MNPETKTLGELIASEDEQIHRNAWSILKKLLRIEREKRGPCGRCGSDKNELGYCPFCKM